MWVRRELAGEDGRGFGGEGDDGFVIHGIHEIRDALATPPVTCDRSMYSVMDASW